MLPRLLTFLNKATTVGSALAVQDRIDQTQLIVEQLSAELKQLNETVSFSTLSLSLSEKPVKHAIVHHGTASATPSVTRAGSSARAPGPSLLGLSAALPFIVLIAILAPVAYYAARSASPAAGPAGTPGRLDRRLPARASDPAAPAGAGRRPCRRPALAFAQDADAVL